MKVREKWTKREWILTISMLIFFPPLGLAALTRWLFYKNVYYVQRNDKKPIDNRIYSDYVLVFLPSN